MRGRFVRLQIPSAAPIFFHLDEVEVYGPGAPERNLALHRPANQSSISQWSTAKSLKPPGRRAAVPNGGVHRAGPQAGGGVAARREWTARRRSGN